MEIPAYAGMTGLRWGDGALRRLQAVVDSGAQVFTGFEIWDVLAGELHWVAGLGVAAHARGAVVKREAAETANFYALIGYQG